MIKKYIKNFLYNFAKKNIDKDSKLFSFTFGYIKKILPTNVLIKIKALLFVTPPTQFAIKHLLDFKKARKRKEFYSQLWKNYQDDPNITAVVSSFNHDYTAKHISDRLKSNSLIDQIIILEDGSTDQTYNIYKENLKDPNHFILSSNDLNTLRTYDKAIRMSRSKYMVIMQDDDIIPDDNSWLHNSIELFEKFPNLALVGGWNCIDMVSLKDYMDPKNISFQEFLDKYATKTVDPLGPEYSYSFKVKHKTYNDPKLLPNHLPVKFTPCCDIGPFVIKTDSIIKSGSIDFSFGDVGKSSCWWEIEMCYRIWKNGFSVINLPMHFHKGGPSVGSDQFYQSDSKKETLETGLRKLIVNQQESFQDISDECRELNELHFKKFK
jgi:glycosyltransferase involved in cell wall biosynthesis